MVIADFNIVCLAQKNADLFHSERIKSTAVNLNSKSVNTYDGWNIFKGLRGFWYDIYPKDRELENYQYDREFFDLSDTSKPYDYTIAALKDKKNKLICIEEYKTQIVNIVDFYLKSSPIHRICFMVRIQDREEEAVLGTLSREEFISKLRDNNLMYNVMYIVSMD